MAYRIAGIDVHEKVLAVVVSDVEVDGEHQFERRMFGGNPDRPGHDSRTPAETFLLDTSIAEKLQ